MKKIVLLMIGLLFLSAIVVAYQVNIDAPGSLTVGKPLIVTGTTTFGVGTPIDVVLYYQLTTSTEIQRKIVYVQSDKTFKAVFDTTDFEKGTYKVEVPANGLGDSVNTRIIQLVDRDDNIFLASSVSQNFTGNIYIAGNINGDENSGVQIEVTDSDGLLIFGPQYVNTDSTGDFVADVPVSQPGNYEVSFTDAQGFIGTRMISVVGQPGLTPVETQITVLPIISTRVAPDESQTAAPTQTSSVLPVVSVEAICLAVALAGIRKIY
jgi:hypothetical protein